MELARARSAAASAPAERAAALARAGDAYERARALARTASAGEKRPGASEQAWRWLGRRLAWMLSHTPGARATLEDRLLGPAGPLASRPRGPLVNDP
jgi:hypothetical protein